MRKTTATIVNNHVVIDIVNRWRCWIVNPIMYDDGKIAYDYPEIVPEYIKPKVRQMLAELRASRKGETLTNDPDYMYVVKDDPESNPYGTRSYCVSNFDGSVKYQITGWKVGKHNWTGSRIDFWFIHADGRRWHGVQYGSKRPICNWHCKVTPTKHY